MQVPYIDPMVAGYVRFERTVPVEVLTALLPIIRTLGVDSCWIDLHVRPSGNDGTNVIQMTYRLDRSGKRTQRKFTSRILGFLKNKFGTTFEDGREKINEVHHYSLSTIAATA